LINSYEQSPLHKLTNKDDIKDIETVLKTNNIIPSWVTMRTHNQKGGKYRVLLLSFHLIMPSHTISCIGGNSSKYMTTGVADNGRTKEEITDDMRRGGKRSSTYVTTNITQGGRTKEDVTADKRKNGKAGGSMNLGCQNINRPVMLLELQSSAVDPNAPLVKKFTRNQADIADVLLKNKFINNVKSSIKERIKEWKDKANNSDDKSHPFTTKKQGLRPDSAPRATDRWILSLHESEESVKAFAPEATRVTIDKRKVSESYREAQAPLQKRKR
jgi:hypothetical protein